MDVPEKYQSTDNLECPLSKGYFIECELMDICTETECDPTHKISSSRTTGYPKNILKHNGKSLNFLHHFAKELKILISTFP